MSKTNFTDYFLGLDIGTNSIGWAVTDNEYNIQKFNGKAMWGIRLFEEGKTAATRRLQRTARRRTQRKVQRIKLLQEIFSEEITQADQAFFQRLNDSKYHIEDKEAYQMNTLFNDSDYNDKQYHKTYPTIYHLRKALIEGNSKFDIRLVYLALHHIIKHRGHFLFEGENFESIADFNEVFISLLDGMNDEFETEIEYQSIEDIKETIKSTVMGINDKKKKLSEFIYSRSPDADKKQIKAITHILAGASIKLSDLFADETLSENENNKIQFGKSNFEDKYDEWSDLLNERMFYVDKLKSIYDWGILEKILNGKDYISFAKTATYEKHKSDLRLLKSMVKKYIPDEYYDVFKEVDHKTNYSAYIGRGKINKKKTKTPSKCSQEEFLKYLSKIFEKFVNTEDGTLKRILAEIANGTFLPKQVSKENGVLPYQVHLRELNIILENAAKHFAFLSGKDESGFTSAEKIIKIFRFRIPYYVGPLNAAHKKDNIEKGTCWITKRVDAPIRPWNFEEVVDVDKCAEDFIMRMTNKCTYLIGADVIPKNALLYSEYMVLNELNNLKINGDRVSNDLKIKIVNELFKRKKKVTQKAVRSFLKIEGLGADLELTGIDGDFKSSLASFIDFNNIIGEKIKSTKMVEEIIRWIVLFGDDKKILRKRIEDNYMNELSHDEIKRMVALKYSGWGRFSREFLKQIYHVDKGTGEVFSVIHALRDNSKNLMELLSREYDFAESVRKYNEDKEDVVNGISYKLVEDLYVSPAIKRSIWQTILIVDEIVKVRKKPPKKIFIEMARGPQEKKRTVSRRKQLIDLYKKSKEETRNQWINKLDNESDTKLRSDRLYLYYTQTGRCMYSNEGIDLDKLFDKNVYDIDHVYPQSKVKDDSLRNRVLVKKTYNARKGDKYPIPTEFKQFELWKRLYDSKLISEEKYNRLTRNAPFTNDELANFISRQIVETRQSTKATASLLEKVYGNNLMVYVKAGNVSRFRQEFDILKCRAVNDYHHAKDAYLNIIVGNVFDTKFTRNPYVFINRGEKYSLNEKALYANDVVRNGYYAWKKSETIIHVKKVMNKNNILFTRYAYENKGQLFDLMPMRKGKGQLPLKLNDDKLQDISKYGGYNKIAGAYFTFVEHKQKGKIIRSIEYVPVYLSNDIEKDKFRLIDYLEKTLELQEVNVLLPKIKIDALFKVNGFLMHLSSRTNNRLLFKHAIQLRVSPEEEQYLKKVLKYDERVQKSKKSKNPIQLPDYEHDKISREKNIEIYDMFLHKLKNTVYKEFLSTQIEKFENGRSIFVELTENEQSEVLSNALHLFQCNRVESNLILINGVKKAGNITLLNKVSEDSKSKKKISIINQSPTGLFEKEVSLSQL